MDRIQRWWSTWLEINPLWLAAITSLPLIRRVSQEVSCRICCSSMLIKSAKYSAMTLDFKSSCHSFLCICHPAATQISWGFDFFSDEICDSSYGTKDFTVRTNNKEYHCWKSWSSWKGVATKVYISAFAGVSSAGPVPKLWLGVIHIHIWRSIRPRFATLGFPL